MDKRITFDTAPPMGDVRSMGRGDVVWLHVNVEQRKDWGRYVDAIAAAVSRGAEVRRKWEL